MPAEGRENPLLKKGNSDAFFREKYLTKNNIRSSLPDCLFAGGATLCRTPFPSSVFPRQNASLQGGATLCRTPFNPIPNH